MTRQQQDAAQLIIRAVNALLTAEGQSYRVTDDFRISRRNGYTLIALPETQDAVDWRNGAPPINRQQEARP